MFRVLGHEVPAGLDGRRNGSTGARTKARRRCPTNQQRGPSKQNTHNQLAQPTVTRRNLVAAGGVVLGFAAAHAAGFSTSEAQADEASAPVAEVPSFLAEPEVGDIAETIDTDVCVVGLGIAGVAATRTLAEAGCSVVAIEKCATPQGRSGDFGAINAACTERYEMTGLDVNEVVSELMKESGYRADANVLKAWAANSGADLDWYFGALPDLEFLPSIASVQPEGADYWVQPERYPLPELWEGNDDEYYPCYQTTVRMYPSHEPALNANLQLAEDTGNVTKLMETSAVKLLTDADGRVTGVVARVFADGSYVQVNAKATILATGDISGNPEMLHYYAPQTDGIMALFPPTAPEGGVPNTGDGQRMGMLAGAVLETGPYAPMIHHMGDCMGSACFLELNRNGQRYMNEDVPGQQLENQIENQPGRVSYQFFDGAWRDQVPHFKPEHGAVCYVLEDGAIADGKVNATLTHKDSYASQEQIDESVAGGSCLKADTIDIEAAKASIERYNELARAGHDDDFGKKASRMFALETPPFYAAKLGTSAMLVCMCGLQSDAAGHTYDADGNVKPGLYVAGNVMGNRFKVQYPTTVPGISHSVCLTEGRIAANTAMAELA